MVTCFSTYGLKLINMIRAASTTQREKKGAQVPSASSNARYSVLMSSTGTQKKKKKGHRCPIQVATPGVGP